MDNQSQKARIGVLLAVLGGAPFLASLDLFVVNVAFEKIGAAFPGHSLGDLSWILSSYAIVYAALLIPFGRVADRIGHRFVFMLGVGVFTLASAIAAASPSLAVLDGARVLQAAGAAALTPTSLGLLIHGVPQERRTSSVRIWAAFGSSAAALGPVVGGFLVEIDWRWVFIINVPVGLLLIAATLRWIPDFRTEGETKRLNLLGAALLTVGIGALALGLVQGPDWGWSGARVVAAFVVAVIALLVFATDSARSASPLIEPALLRVRSFAWSNVAALLFSVGFAAALLAMVLWLQNVWGYSAIRTGLAVAPGPLMVPIFSYVGQRLSRHVGHGAIAALGCLAFAAGPVVVLLSVGQQPAYVSELLPGWLLGGIGVGLALPTILSSATSELPPASASTGSAIVNMSRQIGTVLGVSVLVAILGSPIGYAQAHTVFQHGWAAISIMLVVAGVASLGMTPRPKPAAATEPAPVVGEAA